MVRTYNYNPSTQCLLDFAGVCKPTRRFEPKTTSPTFRRIPTPDWQLKKSNKSELQYEASRIPHPAATKYNYPSNYSSTSNGSSSNGSYHIPTSVEITGNITQLFGVRSVLIGGQRFYQPIDMSEKFGQFGRFSQDSGFAEDNCKAIGASKEYLEPSHSTGKVDQGLFSTLRYASSLDDLAHGQRNYTSNNVKSVKAAFNDRGPLAFYLVPISHSYLLATEL